MEKNDKRRINVAQARTFERLGLEFAAGLSCLVASINEDLAKFNEETADDIDEVEKVENVVDFRAYMLRSWKSKLEEFHSEGMEDLDECLTSVVVYEEEDGEE